MKQLISIETLIDTPFAVVWEMWTNPEHIVKWNQASPDWHCPSASNDLTEGGEFSYRMEAKDGSFGFDFSGIHTLIGELSEIRSTLGDGRKMVVTFERLDEQTRVAQVFEAEDQNTLEMQKAGWNAILQSFTDYVHSQNALK